MPFSDVKFSSISEERKKQLIHASGDVVLFALRFGLGFIPGAGSILEVALPIAGFAINRGKIALANRVGKKPLANGDADDQPADDDGAQTLDDAVAKIEELMVHPREALAIMYEQGKLTPQQYEAVLAAIIANEVEQEEENRIAEDNNNKVKPPSSAGDLVGAVKVLAQEIKEPINTAILISKTEDIIKRRTRTCGICKAPGVDRRSHKLGHKNAHLHVFTEAPPSPQLLAQPPVPPSPKTPTAAPIAATSSTGSTSEGKSHCGICGAAGVNVKSHILGHEKAHLHDFSKDVTSPVPSSPNTPAAPVGKTSSDSSDSNQKSPHCSICGAAGVNMRTHVLGHPMAHLHDFNKDSGAKKK